MRSLVEFKDVSYKVMDGHEEKYVLNKINVSFGASEIITVSGPSGSGKTTLLYAIAGLLEHMTGELNILDKDILKCSRNERDSIRLNEISMVYQNLNLFSFMDVEENILLPFYIKRKTIVKEIRKELDTYLNIMKLAGMNHRSIQSLSGGEQQRVAIIRAVLDTPKLILCDEPTANLDRKNAETFMTTLETISKQTNATIIIVTHDQHVFDYGTSKFYMEDGELFNN